MQNRKNRLPCSVFLMSLIFALHFLSFTPASANKRICKDVLESQIEPKSSVHFFEKPRAWVVHFRDSQHLVQKVTELESRVSFTNSSVQRNNAGLTSFLIDKYFPGAPTAIKKLAANRNFKSQEAPKLMPGVWLAPLNSKFEVLHKTAFAELQTGGAKKYGAIDLTTDFLKAEPESELPNSELVDVGVDLPNIGSIDFGKSGRDVVEVSHWVSWYSETGLYFDTPDRSLESSGWAVRLKILTEKNQPFSSRSLTPDSQSMKNAKRMTLTIKYSAGKLVGPFTQRTEYHVFLPLDFDISMASSLALTVLKSIDPKQFRNLSELDAYTRVDTNRMGLNVIAQLDTQSKPVKVGFITIDQFARFNSDSNCGLANCAGSGIQTEFEILPHFGQLLVSHPTLWQELQNLARSFIELGGTYDNQPKYLSQEIRDIPRDPR